MRTLSSSEAFASIVARNHCRPILTRESVSADKSDSRRRQHFSLWCYAMSTPSSSHVVLTDASTGRKGLPYDWQALLIPSDTVFEASLQMMLATPTVVSRSRKSRRRS
ncbi:MAG: hypothetical protein EBZ46_02615 [Actinobacteria bacterium]|nr:hypothetical protein [Actinomycetota bacterium]